MKKLYKMVLDFRRNGCLEGVFVADDADIEKLRDQDVYFGECLGKHSEVVWTFDDLDDVIKPVTDDETFIKLFEELGLATGYNPLDYFDDSEEDEGEFDSDEEEEEADDD